MNLMGVECAKKVTQESYLMNPTIKLAQKIVLYSRQLQIANLPSKLVRVFMNVTHANSGLQLLAMVKVVLVI